MTLNEFGDTVKSFVRNYVAENDDLQGKDFDYIFDEVLEKVINDPLCEGVEMGMDDLLSNHPEYDYCDAHEEERKIEGKWGTRG